MTANVDLRSEFDSRVKPKFQKTHTPQCKKCKRFYPWGNGMIVIHHIVALCDGGNNDLDNLVVLCDDCHHEWHEEFDNGEIDFDNWIQQPPLWAYSKIGKVQDEEKRLSMIENIIKSWTFIADQIMVTSPYRTENYKNYVNEHSSEWLDW